jgi:glutathione S-transferase
MLKILGRVTSINVRKVLWCCEELGLGYEREDWGAGFRSTQEPEFLTLNPNAQIPVLVDGGFVLWESNSILRYLANAHGGEWLYPADPQRRARIDQWMDWQATDFNGAWSYVFPALMRNTPPNPDPQRLAAGIDAWGRCIATLERRLEETGAYVAGQDFSLADIPMALSVHRWRETPVPHGPTPVLDGYFERLAVRAGFRLYCSSNMP